MKYGYQRRMSDLITQNKYLKIRETKDKVLRPYLQCVNNIYFQKVLTNEECNTVQNEFVQNVKNYLHTSVPDYYHYINLITTSHGTSEEHTRSP